MAQFRKVPPENAEYLDKALEAVPEADKLKMFGCPAWFLNGNMFVAAHQEDIILRLPEADREDLMDRELAKLFTPMGRVMREYVVILPPILDSASEFEKWLLRARDYALSLPPKVKKPK